MDDAFDYFCFAVFKKETKRKYGVHPMNASSLTCAQFNYWKSLKTTMKDFFVPLNKFAVV